jgi:hypothetical protein
MGQIVPSHFSPVVDSYARSNPREFAQDIMYKNSIEYKDLLDDAIEKLDVEYFKIEDLIGKTKIVKNLNLPDDFSVYTRRIFKNYVIDLK